ncbi:MAG: LUD domain-containing protein [Candidatus Baldrarchaeia archaeon]
MTHRSSSQLYEKLKELLERVERDPAIRLNRPAVQMASEVVRRSYLAWMVGDEARRLREKVRGIRVRTIADLDKYLERAIKSLENAGFEVFIARTADEARKYAEEVVGDARLVVKSKTTTADEVGIPEMLEEKGIKVVETDLGERIMQLLKPKGWMPSHPMAPSAHIPLKEIADVFSREVGEPVRPTFDSILAAARRSLRRYFIEADVGISGANSISADEGVVWIVENEGNIRHVTNLPERHLIVAGIEKVAPTLQDSLTIVYALSKFVLPERVLATYVSMIRGPSWSADLQGVRAVGVHGPRKVHVLFIDNGRWKMLNEGFEEALYCIHCGNCLLSCPVYGNLCWYFGWKKYPVAWGIVHSAFSEGIEAAVRNGLFFCLQCGSCREICAVAIDWPALISKLRARAISEGFCIPPFTELRENIAKYGSIFPAGKS